MKKRIACGSAAILLAGLTGAMFATAASRARETVHASSPDHSEHHVQATTATPLADGAAVRVASTSIDAGWHKGRMHLDANQCWMVKLDKATKDGYTMIAVIGVADLQVARGESWVPVDVKAAVKAQPARCMEYDAD